MINWKLIATLLSQEYFRSAFGGKYNMEFLARSWSAHFDFKPDNHHNPLMMSGNYAVFYNFFMTLASQVNKKDNEKVADIISLLQTITGGFNHKAVKDIFSRGGYSDQIQTDLTSNYLDQYGNFHNMIIKHSKKLFEQKNYFHAVHEACKAYNNKVKELSGSKKDGTNLMQVEFSSGGSIRINDYKSESEVNEQNGIKSLSEGLVSAFRNPTSHENALNWNINKQDCLDILSLVSFLFRKIDNAKVIKP